MEEIYETSKDIEQVETLENEVKIFADALPYWAKYISNKILSGIPLTENEIQIAYTYLLEELKLIPETDKPILAISYSANIGAYKQDLIFSQLQNVQGVNALAENQIITFSPHITVVYGSNGSGKSGYVRLLKKAFYSKAPEDILHNVYIETGHKNIYAEFEFDSAGIKYSIKFPDDSTANELRQFAVFDGKSVTKHLENRNEFEFRPAGLSFFSDFTEAFNEVAEKLNQEITNKTTENNYAAIFDGDSEIKTFILGLSEKSNINDLKKHLPYSDQDKESRKEAEQKYDALLLATKNKDKEIADLEKMKELLRVSKVSAIGLNSMLSPIYLTRIAEVINDCVTKEAAAKAEGIENFKSETIKEIGSNEWKAFIQSAENFALKQKKENGIYPENGDNCLLCHQSLSGDAQELINKYWVFIKSQAEQQANKANETLSDVKNTLLTQKYDLFPENDVLTIWLNTNHQKFLSGLKNDLTQQKELALNIISDITSKKANKRTTIAIDIAQFETMVSTIETQIKLLQENEQTEALNRFKNTITFYIHKEKLESHIASIETYVTNQIWISKANSLSWQSLKSSTTNAEKRLSKKYFNQKYIDAFNAECELLKASFQIEVDPKSSGAKSNRQLFIKGKNPSTILSEGEQKVIALADFLSEMKLSEVNKGIIFDDPVTSLDEMRKSEIAERLVKEAISKQVIIFTHDLVFVSSLIATCEELKIGFDCHWIEKHDEKPGTVWLKNTPSFEKSYKKSGKAQEYYNEAQKSGPEQREDKLKNGFAALRTSYESLVVFDLFKGVVQRFNERVSVDSLSSVAFTTEIRDELLDSFYQCCRYMEGHLHSDKYAYKKPELDNLNEEILRFNAVKKKIADLTKTTKND